MLRKLSNGLEILLAVPSLGAPAAGGSKRGRQPINYLLEKTLLINSRAAPKVSVLAYGLVMAQLLAQGVSWS